MQKVRSVRWFHDRYYSRLYSNFAKKGAELVYLDWNSCLTHFKSADLLLPDYIMNSKAEFMDRVIVEKNWVYF